MDTFSKKAVMFLNRNNIRRFGGNFVPPHNLLHDGSLDYLEEMVSARVFGAALYPHYYDQAGLYLFNIISNHVFTDGNKRTGLDTCLLILQHHGYQLQNTVTDAILTGFIQAIATASESLESVQLWIKDNTEVNQ